MNVELAELSWSVGRREISEEEKVVRNWVNEVGRVRISLNLIDPAQGFRYYCE